MKAAQTLLAVAVIGVGLLSTTGAQAGLETRLGGLALYDTDLNVTWVADSSGVKNWAQASDWASGLVVAGISGWRLPNPDLVCGMDWNCLHSEMGHLFYSELGGLAGVPIAATHDIYYTLFPGLQSATYWTGADYAPDVGKAWIFGFSDGTQRPIAKVYFGYALAVQYGDVAAVPEPQAAVLMLTGLTGLALALRRRSR